MRIFSIAALSMALAAPCAGHAGPQEAARRALIERDQQSALFSLQLQQSQQRIDLPAGSPAQAERDRLNLEQQQAQQRLGEQQLRQLTRSPGYDRARIERERRAQQLQFGTPSWGPKLEPSPHWTPTLEPTPPPGWTPTLRGN
jgi:hypothetical protein